MPTNIGEVALETDFQLHVPGMHKSGTCWYKKVDVGIHFEQALQLKTKAQLFFELTSAN